MRLPQAFLAAWKPSTMRAMLSTSAAVELRSHVPAVAIPYELVTLSLSGSDVLDLDGWKLRHVAEKRPCRIQINHTIRMSCRTVGHLYSLSAPIGLHCPNASRAQWIVQPLFPSHSTWLSKPDIRIASKQGAPLAFVVVICSQPFAATYIIPFGVGSRDAVQ